MGSEWPVVRLGDYVDSSLGKMLDAKKNKGELHPYLGNSNVRWGQIDLRNLAEMRFEEHEQERYQLLPGDLVVCEGGEPGRCAIWRDQIPGMKIQKALHRVRAKPGLKNEYLYYWLTLAARLGTLEPYFTGTTIKHLTGRALAELPVPLPPIKVQESIVAILGKVDERIDNLAQTNATLEAIAQALFKSWFVDFGPVRAKAEGRDPEGMDAATAALFPSEFEDSELGQIPKGWHVRPFGSLLANSIGGDWGNEVATDEQTERVAIIRGTDIPDLRSQSDCRVPIRFTTPRKVVGRALAIGDLVVEVSGGSKGQPTGRSLYVTNELLAQFDCSVVPASFCRKFSPATEQIGLLLAQHMDSIYAAGKTWEYQNQSTGIANFQTKHFLANENVVVPSEEVLDAFYKLVGPMVERTQLLQARCLGELRDTLLPRLISGKLRLPDAEREVEAATA